MPAGVNEDAASTSLPYDAAQRLIDIGCVLDVRILQAGCVVTGVVSEERSPSEREHKHRVYIRRPAGARSEHMDGHDLDDPRIEAECSCAERSPCVHIAAVSIVAARSARASTPAAHRGVSISAPSRRPEAFATEASAQQRLLYLVERSAEIQLSIWVSPGASRSERSLDETACLFAPRFSHGTNEFPRYVDAQDKEILAALMARQVDGPWHLRGGTGAELLQRAVATGRAFWRSLRGQALRGGSPRRLNFAWEGLPNGDQRFACVAADAIEIVLDLEPALYIDATTSELGLLELPCSLALLRRYWNQPAVEPERVPAVNEQIAQQTGTAEFPRLNTLPLQAQPFSSLRAKLVLSAGPEATLYFVYNGLPVDSRSLRIEQDTVRKVAEGVFYEIPRERAAEELLRAQLDRSLPSTSSSSEAWLAFVMEAVPLLQADGWDIVVHADFPYRVAVADEWYVDAQTDRQPGWFSLRLGVIVGGQHINLLPALTRYLQTAMPTAEDPSCHRVGEQWLVRLDDGRYVPIALERIRRIAATLVELFDHSSLDEQQALALPKAQSSRLAQVTRELNGPTLRSPDDSLRTLIDDLQNFSGIQPLPAPARFGAALRPYQEEGLGWLQFLRRYRLGGILADDMGLGKTVQTLAHLALEKEQGRLHGPSLIVAPVSVIGNWQQEIARFAPQLKLLTLHGSRRKESFPLIGQADIVVTGYPLLQLDGEMLQAHEFYFLILDEAQTIKNPRAKVSQAARALRSEHRLCLTGTPMENHLGELWSLFDFLQPGLLGEERYFQRHYRTPIEKNGHELRAQALSQRVAPFLLRRTKDSVAKELPDKMEIVEAIVLEEKQRDFYDGIRLAMHRHLREVIQEQGLARSQITILDALLKLRQACCDPRLIRTNETQESIPSAKLDWLRTALPELVADGRRILLFSQFTSMLRLIEEAVTALSIPYCLLTGATKHRSAEVARFNPAQCRCF